MREILKIISIPVNGKPMDLRLTKLDAFSGVTFLRLMAKMPEEGAVTDPAGSILPCPANRPGGSGPAGGIPAGFAGWGMVGEHRNGFFHPGSDTDFPDHGGFRIRFGFDDLRLYP